MAGLAEDDRSIPLTRPPVPRSVLATLDSWLAWFGLARLVMAAVSVAVIAAGAFWLLRTPSPPVEATLPVAGAATTPVSTLALPSAAAEAAATTTSDTAPQLLVVHVAGAVTRPGVYQLGSSARVVDAIEAAGGTTGEADANRVNLAAPVADGERIYVPAIGEVTSVDLALNAHPSDTGDRTTPTGPLDVNTATAGQLEQLPGIGPATAAAIVDDRDRNGPFASVDDLDRVSGIGPAKLAALVGLVTV